MNLIQKERIRPKTLAWVGGLHVLVLILALSLPLLFQSKPKPQEFIEWMPAGSLDPGAGAPDAQELNSGTQEKAPANTTQEIQSVRPPEPAPPTPIKSEPKQEIPVEPTPPQPTPPVKPVEKVQKTEPKTEPVKKVEVAKEQPKPAPPKESTPPKKTTVQVSKTLVSQSGSSGSSQAKSSSANFSGNSPNASQIAKQLASKVGAGTENGTGQGKSGSPGGNPDASWYSSYIRDSLKKNWNRPAVSDPSIFTRVTIRIKTDGSLSLVSIAEPSGNAVMDNSVVDAVKNTPKLGKPLPQGLGDPDYVVTIRFEFPN